MDSRLQIVSSIVLKKSLTAIKVKFNPLYIMSTHVLNSDILRVHDMKQFTLISDVKELAIINVTAITTR